MNQLIKLTQSEETSIHAAVCEEFNKKKNGLTHYETGKLIISMVNKYLSERFTTVSKPSGNGNLLDESREFMRVSLHAANAKQMAKEVRNVDMKPIFIFIRNAVSNGKVSVKLYTKDYKLEEVDDIIKILKDYGYEIYHKGSLTTSDYISINWG